MRLIRAVCPSCGANLDFDIDGRHAYCTYCGAKMFVDNETIHVHHENGEQFGYEFEKGRLRAIEESERQKRESERLARQATKTDDQKSRDVSASSKTAVTHASGTAVKDTSSLYDEKTSTREAIFGLLRFVFWTMTFIFLPLILGNTVLGEYNSNTWFLGFLITATLFFIVRRLRRARRRPHTRQK